MKRSSPTKRYIGPYFIADGRVDLNIGRQAIDEVYQPADWTPDVRQRVSKGSRSAGNLCTTPSSTRWLLTMPR